MRLAKEKGIKLAGEVQRYLKRIEEIADDVEGSEFEAIGCLRKINDLVKRNGWIVQASEYTGEISSKKDAIWVPDDLFGNCNWNALSIKLNEMEQIVYKNISRYGTDFKQVVDDAAKSLQVTEEELKATKKNIKKWFLDKQNKQNPCPEKLRNEMINKNKSQNVC